MEVDELENWKDQEIICYCRSGTEAVRPVNARSCRTAGFADVKTSHGRDAGVGG